MADNVDYNFMDWHAPGSTDNPYGSDGLGEQGGAFSSNDYLGVPLYADPNWLSSIGFTGNPTQDTTVYQGDNTVQTTGNSQALDDYLKNNGLSLQTRSLPGFNTTESRYVNGSGQPVGMNRINHMDYDKTFGTLANIALAVASGGASAAGLGSMGGTVGNALGASGQTANVLGNAVINTGMNTVANGGNVGSALKDQAMSGGLNEFLSSIGAPISSAISSMTGGSMGEGQGMFGSGLGGNILSGLADLWKYNQSQKGIGQMMSGLTSLYTPGSPYEQALRTQLERRDAAAGRRSQYGPREVELQAKMAQMASGQIGPMTNLMGMYNMNRNNAMNSAMQKYLPKLAQMFGSRNNQGTPWIDALNGGGMQMDQGAAAPSTGPSGSYMDNPYQSYDGGYDYGNYTTPNLGGNDYGWFGG